MDLKSLIIVLTLTAPALAGCIAGDAEPASEHLPSIDDPTFQVSSFVQDLEAGTGSSLVTAQVESLQIEVNQSQVSLVEWRSFTRSDTGCELVSTMVYEGQGRSGGFMVHHEDEPCPLSLSGQPTVAEVVALVDRVPLTMLQSEVVRNAPVYSVSVAGYCGYTATDGNETVHVWNGAGVTEHTGQVRCGGGPGSALTLAVTVPASGPGQASPQSYVILEQVPAR